MHAIRAHPTSHLLWPELLWEPYWYRKAFLVLIGRVLPGRLELS